MKMSQALSKVGHDTLLIAPEYNRQKGEIISKQDLFAYYDIQFPFSIQKTQGFFKGYPGLIIHMLQVYLYALLYKPDVIYSRCLFSAWFLTFMGKPVIYERHDSFIPQSRSWKLFDQLLKRRSLKAVVVISQSLKRHLCQTHNILESAIVVAPDGADIVKEAPEPLPNAWGNFQIGYVGHLYRGRGIDVIIESARRLPDCGFHIIGGTKKDLQFWQEECGDLGNIFFYGHLPHAQAARYLGSFDIVLAPYQRKIEVSGGGGDISKWISPLKLFEYMAAGRPIIASDIEVLKEVLEDGRNCLLCSPDDPDCWKRAIERLKNDPDFTLRIGREAKKDFLEKYSWDSRVKNIFSSVDL
jgi:glycosyltransferase involved in cell wall biosynthesis